MVTSGFSPLSVSRRRRRRPQQDQGRRLALISKNRWTRTWIQAWRTVFKTPCKYLIFRYCCCCCTVYTDLAAIMVSFDPRHFSSAASSPLLVPSLPIKFAFISRADGKSTAQFGFKVTATACFDHARVRPAKLISQTIIDYQPTLSDDGGGSRRSKGGDQ